MKTGPLQQNDVTPLIFTIVIWNLSQGVHLTKHKHKFQIICTPTKYSFVRNSIYEYM